MHLHHFSWMNFFLYIYLEHTSEEAHVLSRLHKGLYALHEHIREAPFVSVMQERLGLFPLFLTIKRVKRL